MLKYHDRSDSWWTSSESGWDRGGGRVRLAIGFSSSHFCILLFLLFIYFVLFFCDNYLGLSLHLSVVMSPLRLTLALLPARCKIHVDDILFTLDFHVCVLLHIKCSCSL